MYTHRGSEGGCERRLAFSRSTKLYRPITGMIGEYAHAGGLINNNKNIIKYSVNTREP